MRKDGGIEWPPYSPDLNPCDFFLWGFLKDNVFRNAPRTLLDMKEAISKCLKEIPISTFEAVCAGFENRLRDVVLSDGGHFENLIS